MTGDEQADRVDSPVDARFEGRTLDGTTIAVYGLGKMGLPLAAVLADHGARTIGVDVDDAVVDAVNEGTCPVENEPGLPELVDEYADRSSTASDGRREATAATAGSLTATADGAGAASDADAMIALVPTVLDDEGRPDLSPLMAVASDVREGVEPGDLVITESTLPPGTTAGQFADAVSPDGLEAGVDFGIAHCPERTASGRVLRDLTGSYPKIVGGLSEEGTAAVAALYETFNEPGVHPVESPTAAEAVKVFEGVYRDANIALANELARACEHWGISASETFEAANGQPYCHLHTPGCGVGGHCIPVYPHFVADRAPGTELVETARGVNEEMPTHTVALLETLLSDAGRDLSEATVLVLGVTYRAGVRETRYAPAIDVFEILRGEGAEVLAHDPLLSLETIRELGAKPVEEVDGAHVYGHGVDGLVLVTGHGEYGDLDLDGLADGMRTPVLVDGRNFFDERDVSRFGYAAIGEGSNAHPRYAGDE